MFTSAKDIMKIIWNGLREIKKNCSDYYDKDARKIYEETLNGVKEELSGPEPEEKRKDRLVKNRWEKMRVERKIAVVSILTILVCDILWQMDGFWDIFAGDGGGGRCFGLVDFTPVP